MTRCHACYDQLVQVKISLQGDHCDLHTQKVRPVLRSSIRVGCQDGRSFFLDSYFLINTSAISFALLIADDGSAECISK